MTFTMTAHVNRGRLGSRADGRRPWMGKPTLEKAIFAFALVVFVTEHDLDPGELLAYYNLDVPGPLMMARRLSFPILLDIRAHILAVAMAGDDAVPFKISPKLRQTMDEAFGPR